MTLETFIKNYGSLALSLGAAFAVYVVWSKLAIARLEGRAATLEKHDEAQDKALAAQSTCINSLQAKETDEKLREYKAEESTKKLDALTKAVSEGFARIDGALGQQALQNVQIIGDLGNLKKSNEKAREKLDKHEKALIALGVEVDEP